MRCRSAPGSALRRRPGLGACEADELSPLVEQPVERRRARGQNQRGEWTRRRGPDCAQACRAAHEAGLWIRFYTLNGHSTDTANAWDGRPVTTSVARRGARPVARGDCRGCRFHRHRSIRRVRTDFIPLSPCRYASVVRGCLGWPRPTEVPNDIPIALIHPVDLSCVSNDRPRAGRSRGT